MTVASREMYPGPEAGTFLGLRWTRLVADKSSFGCAYDIDDNVRRYTADTVQPIQSDLTGDTLCLCHHVSESLDCELSAQLGHLQRRILAVMHSDAAPIPCTDRSLSFIWQ